MEMAGPREAWPARDRASSRTRAWRNAHRRAIADGAMRMAALRRVRAGAAVLWRFWRFRPECGEERPVRLHPPRLPELSARYLEPVIKLRPENVRRPLAVTSMTGEPARGDRTSRAPLLGYTLVGGAFGLTLVGVSALGKSVDRPVELPTSHELVMLAAATFKASRIVSHERVGSVVRAPFVEGDSSSENAEPAGEGLQRAIGELVTCSRCVGTWAALGLISTRIVAPRTSRLLVVTLAVGAANDFLQAGFRALCTASE